MDSGLSKLHRSADSNVAIRVGTSDGYSDIFEKEFDNMLRTFLAASLVTTLVTSVSSNALAAPPFPFLNSAKKKAEPAKVQWQPSLQEAHKVATAQNKPMLLVFGAEWCHFCKKLEKETLDSPQMAAYVNESFVAVHLDADKDKKAVEILKISGLPCSVVLSPGAEMLGRIEGYHQAPAFHQQLMAAKQKHQLIQRTAVSGSSTTTK